MEENGAQSKRERERDKDELREGYKLGVEKTSREGWKLPDDGNERWKLEISRAVFIKGVSRDGF